jgi:hypothetical protein
MTRGRLEQLFHLNHIVPGASTSTVLVFYPNQPVGSTEAVAAKCRLDPGRDALHFSVVLHEAKRIDIDLDKLKLAIR